MNERKWTEYMIHGKDLNWAPTKHMSEVTPLNKVEYTFNIVAALQFSTEDQ